MIKKTLSLFLVAFITVFLCGCAGYKETNEELTVSLIGIDKSKNGIKMTVQTVLPDTDGNVDCKTVSAVAKDMESAYDRLRDKTVKPLIFEHCVGAALGGTLEKSDVSDFLKFAEQKPDINLSLNFFYTDNAEGFLVDSGNYRQGGYDVIELIKNNKKSFKNKLFMIERELYNGSVATVPFLVFKGDEAIVEKTVILEGLSLE